MAAGMFGYMGYDTVRLIERLPNAPQDALGMPDGVLMRPTLMVIFDNVQGRNDHRHAGSPGSQALRQKAYKAAASA